MPNRKKYIKLLQELKSKDYVFSSFEKRNIIQKLILLRHDIDSNLEFALDLATIENELDIKSTYFIMLKSPIYNIFSRSNESLLRKIIYLGHDIGLHFDSYNVNENELQKNINSEIDILNKRFDINVKVVSFHQPSQEIINNQIKINQINTYDKEDMSEIFYISDSNASLRVLDIELLTKYPKIQMLIHPMWWVHEEFISTEQCWNNAIMNNFSREEKQLLSTERAYGEKRCVKIK